MELLGNILLLSLFLFIATPLEVEAASFKNQTRKHTDVLQKISDLIQSENAITATKLWNTMIADGILSENQNSAISTVIRKSYNSSHSIFDSILEFIFADTTVAIEGIAIKELFDIMQRTGDIFGENIFPLAYRLNKRIKSMSSNDTLSKCFKDHLWIWSKIPAPVKRIIENPTTTLQNLYRGGYLYASNITDGGDDRRRHVFRWIPGNIVTHSKWSIQNFDGIGRQHWLYNPSRGEYLYAGNDTIAFDKERRRVFCWVPKGPVTQGNWTFILNSDMTTVKIYNVRPATEYLYADEKTHNSDTGHIFTNRQDKIPNGSDWIPS